MTRVALILTCALAVAGLGGPRPARAESGAAHGSPGGGPSLGARPKAVVITGEGVPRFDWQAIVNQVLRGLETGGVQAVQPATESFSGYGDCKNDACLDRLASASHAGFVVRVETKPVGKAIDAFAIELTPWNAKTKTMMAPHGPSCSLCGQLEINDMAFQAGAFVARQLIAAAATPISVVPGPMPEPVYRPLWQRVLPLAGVAAGLGAAGWGVYLLTLNGDGTCGQDRCLYVHDSRNRGLTFLGAGLAVAVGSSLLTYQFSKPLAVDLGPGSVALFGRF